MTRYTHVRRRLTAALALIVVVAGLTVNAAPAALLAAPAPGAEPIDDEGSTKSLTDQLEAASKGYVEAQEALERSKKRQTQYAAQLKGTEAQMVQRQGRVDQLMREAYQTGRLGPVTALLNASSPDGFLDRAASLDVIAAKEEQALQELQETKSTQTQAKRAIDAEIRDQQKQLNTMAKRKVQAETALKVARATAADTASDDAGSSGGGDSPQSSAARRNSDGSLPGESCSANDPTTGGCITPRTLNALNSAKSDGFTRFVSCFRSGGSGEHPKGRACDFASDTNGFGGVATGASKNYGDRLANYFIANASRLGVLYVIWFNRIWLPSSGWRAYSRGNGDPSSDHTNHVHLSMR